MRKLPLIFAFGSIFLIAIGTNLHPAPRFVWNASASVPIGLYAVISGAPEKGDLVLVRMPHAIEGLADQRHYLPLHVPLVKRITAIGGDVVCVLDRSISINGRVVTMQRRADRKGRLLPTWTACRQLAPSEYFLSGDGIDSFDSRYFGPVNSDHILGRLAPLWTK